MEATSPLPAIVELELHRRCNLKCRMCQRQALQSRERDRTLGARLVDAVLDQCAAGAPQINLGGLGESLLHRGLPALLARIKRHGTRPATGFNTNGLRLTEATWDWLLDGRVDYLSISLNAPAAEDYAWLVGCDAYALICRQARAFLRAKGRGRPPLTTVHVFALPRFASGIAGFVARWSELADFVQVRELGNWAGTVDTAALGVGPRRLQQCQRPWQSLAIDVDGGYHRCCATFALEAPDATVFEVPIADYWQGPAMAWRRAEMSALSFGSGHPCAACSGRDIAPNTLLEHAALATGARQASHDEA